MHDPVEKIYRRDRRLHHLSEQMEAARYMIEVAGLVPQVRSAMNLFSRVPLLGATALVALSLSATVTGPAAASDGTVLKSGATPQLATRADHPAAYKRSQKKQPKKKHRP